MKETSKGQTFKPLYTIKNFVFDIMNAGFDKHYLQIHSMTQQEAKRGKNSKTLMLPKDLRIIISRVHNLLVSVFLLILAYIFLRTDSRILDGFWHYEWNWKSI